MKNVSIKIAGCLLLALVVAATAPAFAANPARDFDLTQEQVDKLADIIADYGQQQGKLVTSLNAEFGGLADELRKPDRFDSRFKAMASSTAVNKRVKKITSLYGELLHNRVKYFLKAKDIFTEEQKIKILKRLLDFDMDMPQELEGFIAVDIPELGLDLSTDQVKKLMRYRADKEIADIRIRLDMDIALIDLQEAIIAEDRKPEAIDKLILSISDLGNRMMENDVNYFLKSKDVLSVAQKRGLMHALMMTAGY